MPLLLDDFCEKIIIIIFFFKLGLTRFSVQVSARDRGSSWLEADVNERSEFSCWRLEANAPRLASRNQKVLVRLVVVKKRREEEEEMVEEKEEWVKKKRADRLSLFSSLNRGPGSLKSAASAEKKKSRCGGKVGGEKEEEEEENQQHQHI